MIRSEEFALLNVDISIVTYVEKIYKYLPLITLLWKILLEINAKSDDFGQNDWEEKLNSDYWKLPPKWTQVSTQKKGIWDRIKEDSRENL